MKKFNFVLVFVFFMALFGCAKTGELVAQKEEGSVLSPKELLALPELVPNLTHSTLTLTAVKDENIPVKATMNLKGGKLPLSSASGELVFDLSSYNSGLPLRNERVVKVFFAADKPEFSSVALTWEPLSDDVLQKLKNDSKLDNADLSGEVTLGSVKQKITAKVSAQATEQGKLVVKSLQPVEISIESLGLNENLKTLMQVCGHNAVSDKVKVDFSIEFQAP